jgi:hypothetical protein
MSSVLAPLARSVPLSLLRPAYLPKREVESESADRNLVKVKMLGTGGMQHVESGAL